MSGEANQTPDHRLDAIEQRIAGLTHAVAAVTAALALRSVAEGNELTEALRTCETDLKRFGEATHASEQVREVISEVKQRLPAIRDEWD